MSFTDLEIEWLARHWVALNEFASNAPLPESLSSKLHSFLRLLNGWQNYEFSDYDEALESRILAKRKELGL